MPETPLKDGTYASDPRLGRIPQQDLRSLNFLVTSRRPKGQPRRPRSWSWNLPHFLDQGQEGACVGFGYSHDLLAQPKKVSGITDVYARKLYWLIQRHDPWDGGAWPGADPFYEGTSVLSGAKIMRELGYYESYEWALNAQEIAEGIAWEGPCILGLDWFSGMFRPDAKGFIRPTGEVNGGHCILAQGVRIRYKPMSVFKRLFGWRGLSWDSVDMERSYVVLHNSWGPLWGVDGRCYLTLADLDLLLARKGDACFPKRSAVKKAVSI